MKKIQLYGKTLKDQLIASARDRFYHFMLAGGTLRGVVLNGTRMVNEMRSNHRLGILETLVLGHAYIAAGLLSANLKGSDRISLQIECDGPIGGLTVEANAFNEVRGYLRNVPIPIEKPLTDFNLGPFFGKGVLSITRYLEDAKQPFTGKVELAHGNLAQDLAWYYLKSEQIPTAFNLSIQFDREGHVTGAGGLFLQAMPGTGEALAGEVEHLVLEMPSLGKAFRDGSEPDQLVLEAFPWHAPKILSSRRVEFLCHCSRERIRNLLTLLPLDELRDILENGPFPLEVRCHYCNSAYRFQRQDIQGIYGMRYPDN